MALKIIDTGDKILVGDNHPQLKIGDKLYLVDDRKSTFDKIQELQNSGEENAEIKTLELALGKEAVKEIVTKDITFQGYLNLSFYVMAAITGEEFETIKQEAMRKN